MQKQWLGRRVIDGGGSPHQHLSESVASLVHAFASRVVLEGVEVNRFAADGAIVFCL
jgi:hypothetical protein